MPRDRPSGLFSRANSLLANMDPASAIGLNVFIVSLQYRDSKANRHELNHIKQLVVKLNPFQNQTHLSD